eukprot:403373953
MSPNYLLKQTSINAQKQPIKTGIIIGDQQQQPFDFDYYKFYDQRKIFDHKEYLEEFVQQGKMNKEKIKKQLMELVYIQVLTKLQSEFPKIPAVFQENKQRWSKLFLKSKPLQDLMNDFSQKIQVVLNKEVNNNKDQLTQYIMHPRISSLSKLAAKRIKDSAHQENSNALIFLNQMRNIKHKSNIRPQNMQVSNLESTNIMLTKNISSYPPGTIFEEGGNSPSNKRKNKFIKDTQNLAALQAQLKLEKDLKEVHIKNEEYQKIMDRVKNINHLVEFMEDNTNELAQDVEKFEQDFQVLEEQKENNHPLHKLHDLLERWSREEPMTTEDLVKFAGEFWMTVQEFEKDLKESLKGHEMILSIKEYKYSSHIDWIKNKFGFYIDFYETTMNELKLKQMRDKERIMMQMNDLESRLLNCQKEESELSRIIYSDTKIKSIQEGTQTIVELKRIMSIMHLQMKQSEQEKNMMLEQINILEDQKHDLQDQLENLQQQFRFYQSISLRSVKELDLLKEEPDKQKLIEETRMDLSKQDEIIKILQEKNLDGILQDTLSTYKIYDICVKEIYTELYKMGIIPIQRIALKKVAQAEPVKVQFAASDEERNKIFDGFEKITKATNQILLLSSVLNNGNQIDPLRKDSSPTKTSITKTTPDKRNSIFQKGGFGLKKEGSFKKKDSAKGKDQGSNTNSANSTFKRQNTTIRPNVSRKGTSNKLGEENSHDLRRLDTAKRATYNYRNITEEDFEDDPNEDYISSKYGLTADQSKDLKRSLRLNSMQIQELQFLIKRCLGKELTTEESVKLFDSNIESFIYSLNQIIINGNQDQMNQKDLLNQEKVKEKEKERKKTETKKSTLRIEDNPNAVNSSVNSRNLNDSTESLKMAIDQQPLKRQQSKIKTKVPLGDCIQLEYNTEGELCAFSLRPKIASYVFSRDESDISSLKEILKVIMYMNRLLLEGENLILGKPKLNTVFTHNQQKDLMKGIHTPSMRGGPGGNQDYDDFDQIDDRDKDLDFKTNTLDQEVQVNQSEDEAMNIIKKHLVDLVCRIAPYQRDKTASLMSNLKGDRLCNYQLRGVLKSNNSDYNVGEYLKEVFDYSIKKVRDIPPFKRRVVEFKYILQGKPEDKKDNLEQDNYSQNKKRSTIFSQHGGKRFMSPQNPEYKLDENYMDEDMEKYIKDMLREEMTNTLSVLDQFLDDQSKGLKTISLNDEVELFPHNQIYPHTTDNKSFPIQKISIAQKLSNLSFHNNFSSFRQKLTEKFKDIQKSLKSQNQIPQTHSRNQVQSHQINRQQALSNDFTNYVMKHSAENEGSFSMHPHTTRSVLTAGTNGQSIMDKRRRQQMLMNLNNTTISHNKESGGGFFEFSNSTNSTTLRTQTRGQMLSRNQARISNVQQTNQHIIRINQSLFSPDQIQSQLNNLQSIPYSQEQMKDESYKSKLPNLLQQQPNSRHIQQNTTHDQNGNNVNNFLQQTTLSSQDKDGVSTLNAGMSNLSQQLDYLSKTALFDQNDQINERDVQMKSYGNISQNQLMMTQQQKQIHSKNIDQQVKGLNKHQQMNLYNSLEVQQQIDVNNQAPLSKLESFGEQEKRLNSIKQQQQHEQKNSVNYHKHQQTKHIASDNYNENLKYQSAQNINSFRDYVNQQVQLQNIPLHEQESLFPPQI